MPLLAVAAQSSLLPLVFSFCSLVLIVSVVSNSRRQVVS
jgi:hypothetical protein